MEKITIEAQCVTLYVYHGPKELLFPTLSQLSSSDLHSTPSKIIKMVFFIHNLPLKEYSSIYQSLKHNFTSLFQTYSINLLIVRDKNQLGELLAHLRRTNSQQFQFNYLKLQDISERRIKESIISNYIEKKFKWNTVKTNYFLEKNKIGTIQDLLNYDKFPHWEQSLVDKTLEFKQYCQQAKERQERAQSTLEKL